MPRASLRPKVESFNFRVDPELKAAFTAATAKDDKPAGQVLRDFMRAYVEQQRERSLAAETRRQSRLVAQLAADPTSEEAEVMRWMEEVSDNQFLVQAAAEKVAALKAHGCMAERAARATPGDLGRVLAKAGTAAPIPGDELPEGWPESCA